MHQNRDTVGRQPDVELDGCNTLRERQLEGWDCVLWCKACGAAMTDHEMGVEVEQRMHQ